MPKSATEQAQAAAAAMLGPNIQAILSAQGQYDANSVKQQRNARGFSLALAKMMKSIGPQVHSAYSNASGSVASFAKGFSDAERHQAENESASLGTFLDSAGVPHAARAQALAHTGGTSDVLYGTHGFSPASAMAREGAAFGAAADQLPQVAVGLGNQTVAKLLQAQNEGDQKYANMLASERGKIPQEAAAILSAAGMTPTGEPKAGYYLDKNGNILPIGTVMGPNGVPVKTGSSSGKSVAKELAPDQPKLNSAAGDMMGPLGPRVGSDGKPYTYKSAAKALFTQFKYLIKEFPKAQQPKAKKVLNVMIREALTGAGFSPPVKDVPFVPGAAVGFPDGLGG